MRLSLFFGLFWCIVSASSSAATITNGFPVVVAHRAMEQGRYKSTRLEMVSRDPAEDYEFWHVDQGYLIFTFSKVSGRIVRTSYVLFDERPKDVRKTFRLEVISFDPSTGVMTFAARKGAP